MSIPSSSRISFRYFHLTSLKPLPNNPSIVQIPTFRTWPIISARPHFSSSPSVARIFDKLYPNADFLPNINFTGFRYLSLKNEMGSKNLVKDAAKNLAVAVKDTFLWYKEAFWKRNHLMLLGAGGIVVYDYGDVLLDIPSFFDIVKNFYIESYHLLFRTPGN